MQPSRLLPQTTPVRSLAWPSVLRHGVAVSIIEGDGRAIGSGVGSPFAAAMTGAGEYIERHVLFSKIHPTHRGRLEEAGGRELSTALMLALSQLSDAPCDLASHEFRFTACHNLLTGVEEPYPTALLTLAQAGIEEDRRYVPYIDSSGSCLHSTGDAALAGAIAEFLERQMLLATWFGLPCTEIVLDVQRLPHRIADFVELLTHRGSLSCFTAESPLGGYFVIAVYSSSHGDVRYSVGSSFALSPRAALEKALHELWHGAIYQWNQAGNEITPDMDVLSQAFLKGNRSETAERFPFVQQPCRAMELDQFVRLEPATMTSVLAHWTDISLTLLAYRTTSGPYHFCRVVDPNFWVHINPGVPLNFDNEVARGLGLSAPAPSQRSQIPFP